MLKEREAIADPLVINGAMAGNPGISYGCSTVAARCALKARACVPIDIGSALRGGVNARAAIFAAGSTAATSPHVAMRVAVPAPEPIPT